MINTVTLVGRIVEEPQLKELEHGKRVTSITLAVGRPFKNMDGNYDTDFIKCVLWEGLAQNACEYCRQGDIIGIRGRITPKTQEIDNSVQKFTINEIIVERLAFIHKHRKN